MQHRGAAPLLVIIIKKLQSQPEETGPEWDFVKYYITVTQQYCPVLSVTHICSFSCGLKCNHHRQVGGKMKGEMARAGK